MSGSVWYPQLNKALKTLIPTVVMTHDESGQLVPIPVVIRTPEPEFEVEKFPSATISSYDERFAQFRYTDSRVVVYKDYDRSVAVIEESAKPYSLYYQIDFWAQYQEDIDTMTMMWSSKFKKHNSLTVIDSSGVERSCYMRLVKIAKADTVSDRNDRIFHRVYSYEIWVELDENPLMEVPLVRKQIIQTK